MLQQTDLESVKATAKALLMTDIHQSQMSPIVHHPFTSTAIVAIQTNGKTEVLNLLANPDNLTKWQKTMSELIDNAKNPFAIFAMVNKPYLLTMLKYSMAYLSKADFSNILANSWLDSEAPNRDVNVTKKQLVAMFKKADAHYLMTEEERKIFDRLEDPVTVYRGVTPYNNDNIRALSWTTNLPTAKWFATRFADRGTVYEALIEKKHILAYFDSRHEFEVVVDPKHLTNIIDMQVMSEDFTFKL